MGGRAALVGLLAGRLIELLDAHGPGLHALLLRITLNREAAAELFQELFARLADSNGFATADNHPAFAYRAAMNLARDWRRRLRRTPPARQLPSELPGLHASASAIEPDELARVFDAVAELDGPARDAICLRYLQQMSYEQVGSVLGRTAHQARALCHSGIARVRRALCDDVDERRVDRVTPRY